jgi:hypothetical protein
VPGKQSDNKSGSFVSLGHASLMLVKVIIKRGQQATFVKYSEGYLPLHVAASHYVSPDKLRLLLDANPLSLSERTVAKQLWILPELLQHLTGLP